MVWPGGKSVAFVQFFFMEIESGMVALDFRNQMEISCCTFLGGVVSVGASFVGRRRVFIGTGSYDGIRLAQIPLQPAFGVPISGTAPFGVTSTR